MCGYILNDLNKFCRENLRHALLVSIGAYHIKHTEKAGQRTEPQLLSFVKAGKKIKAKLNKFFLVIL